MTDTAPAAPPQLQPGDFLHPGVLLYGPVDQAMYGNFRSQIDAAPQQGLTVIELSTLGGDPEVARMMGEDIRFFSAMQPERRFVFLGKAMVYSAGVTFMSFFARANRYLTRGSRLMVHERKMSATLTIEGPLTTLTASLEAKINEIRESIAIQNEGFANLVAGSSVELSEVIDRAPSNWYIEAAEAESRGLIEKVL